MISIKGIIDKVASRKLAMTAAASAAGCYGGGRHHHADGYCGRGAYIIGQGLVDTWGE